MYRSVSSCTTCKRNKVVSPPQELVSEQMQSIFTDMGKLSLQDPAHSAVIPSGVAGGGAGHAATPSTSAAWLGQQGEAHYALAMPTGGIMIVTLPSADSQGRWPPPLTRSQRCHMEYIKRTSCRFIDMYIATNGEGTVFVDSFLA